MIELQAIDSHTEGEPTRTIIAGGPDFGSGDLAARRDVFIGQHDRWRRAVVEEPRGNDVIVGAWLCEAEGADTGVIFFNNAGALGMCGHGTIGVIATLRYLGRVQVDQKVRLATPVGIVTAEPDHDGRIAFENIPASVHALDVKVEVPDYGVVTGDIAWGGNWFFLTHDVPMGISMNAVDDLMAYSSAIRRVLDEKQITGANEGVIDHVELLTDSPNADSRNFVLCPGFAYDRSPCGTGTSAHLACLAARDELPEGQNWVQESVTGGIFHASYQRVEGKIVPRISGRAFVTADSKLLIDPADPLGWGF
ncbi:MAG: proline racemase family protein [Fimbriimonadaceae bacterium]|nr:proline racemase family protein [Fimbriimonadaceae bacterium]